MRIRRPRRLWRNWPGGPAEDARAALEWIAGEQGRAFITQERIQGFCWYELPVKWFVDLDEKLRVVAALAEALDLLQLPRYAAICRSGTTREILNAYEVSTARGLVRLRALARLGEMADRGDFDEFLDNKAAYRR